MHRSSRPLALLLCLLALWLQMLAPALALGMQRHAFDPRAAICHSEAAESQDQHRRTAPHAPSCDHCLVCHAVAAALPDDGRPAFTRFDYPAVSPLRWVPVGLGHSPAELRRTPPPRGPPASV